MQIGQVAPGAKGSFGIPQQVKETGEKFIAKGKEEKRPGMEEDIGATMEPLPEIPMDEFSVDDEDDILTSTPAKNLAKIGVELVDDDLHRYVFRGFIEKEVVLYPSFMSDSSKDFSAIIKTLTAKEYDLADEILAEDLRDTRMTNEGYTSRRSMWILSFGVPKLMGGVLCKPIYKDDSKKQELDLKAMARERHKVLSDVNPDVINELIYIHGVITIALRQILQDRRGDLLKKFSPPRKG